MYLTLRIEQKLCRITFLYHSRTNKNEAKTFFFKRAKNEIRLFVRERIRPKNAYYVFVREQVMGIHSRS